MIITVLPQNKELRGLVEVPSDKSVSQRALIFSLLANNSFFVQNLSTSKDCLSTLEVVKQLGVNVKRQGNTFLLKNEVVGSSKPLFCGNSATAMRLLCGVLSGKNFSSVLTGDESLSSRPMKRVVEPLTLMGAKIEGNVPMYIYPSVLHGIEYYSKISSGQVKSAVLLAGVSAEGTTIYTEPHKSRNHTELMLEYFGADISVHGNTVKLNKSDLVAKDINVAGDFSSAAFLIAAALIVPNSDITIKNVGLNPTRIGFLNVLKDAGASIEVLNEKTFNLEPVGDIRVRYSEFKGFNLSGDIIPNIIDELPLIAVLGCFANGKTTVVDAKELRVKESDRISGIVSRLKSIGARISELEDGFVVEKSSLDGGVMLDCGFDHRIALSLFVAGLGCKNAIKIKDFECSDISFPNFVETIKKIMS